MTYDAIVFDNDGVLTEPTDPGLLRRAVRSAFEVVGVTPREAHVETAVSGDADAIVVACDEHGVDAEEFWRRREIAASRVQCDAIRDGDKPLYDDAATIESLGVDLGLVSNNQHRTVEYLLEHAGWDELFVACHGREPTLAGLARIKPDPHYLERALDALGTRNALYVGDSRVDVAAADAAGIDCAFVRRPHRSGYALDRDPTYEIDGLDDLPSIVGNCR